MTATICVNIPIAVRYYYEKVSLENKDIKKIFGVTSDTTAIRKKKEVIKYFAEQGINPVHSLTNRLDTWRAYEAWGLDITELEKRFKKLKQLGFTSNEEVKGCTDTSASGAAHI
ncbi:MAG: hypothetical protein IJ370_03840 [Oscillospiraceae bacterium]|nr:hypothetical protein [Oscillospiraceae bacterium]